MKKKKPFFFFFFFFFCIDKMHGGSFIIQTHRSNMREGDASVCITPALPLRCITLPGGSDFFFFEREFNTLPISLRLGCGLISASDKSLYLSPGSFGQSRSPGVPLWPDILKGAPSGCRFVFKLLHLKVFSISNKNPRC